MNPQEAAQVADLLTVISWQLAFILAGLLIIVLRGRR